MPTPWPTVAALKAAKKKLEAQPPGKLQQALDLATSEIKGALAGRYSTSGWDADAPPHLYFLAIELAYGHAGRAMHEGDRATPSDQTAEKALAEARDVLKRYETGSRILLDSSGVALAQSGPVGSEFNRVTTPIFGMKDPIQWGISDASAPSSRLGGPDAMGIF